MATKPFAIRPFRTSHPRQWQLSTLAILLLLCQSATAFRLPFFSARDMDPRQIPGTYTNVRLTPEGAGYCPDAIRITQVEPIQSFDGVLYVLPHKFITLPLFGGGATQCQSVPVNDSDVSTLSSTVLRRSIQIPNLNESEKFDIIAQFRLAQEQFYIGFELGPRICGRLSLRPGTISMWMAPSSVIVARASNVTVTFRPGFKYIYYFPEERACLFRGNGKEIGVVKPVASRTPSPTPTPSDTPPVPSSPGLPTVPSQGAGATAQASQSAVAVTSQAGQSFSPPPSLPPSRSTQAECFPGMMRVEVRGRGWVRIDEVRVGEFVLVGGQGKGLFSEVFAFTHSDGWAVRRFVRVGFGRNESLGPLVGTGGHLVYANGEVIRMDEVRVGDVMDVVEGGRRRVERVEWVWGKGLYNLQTFHGDVVVQGVVVTTYSSIVGSAWIAHALLAPVRFLQRFVVKKGFVELVRCALGIGTGR